MYREWRWPAVQWWHELNIFNFHVFFAASILQYILCKSIWVVVIIKHCTLSYIPWQRTRCRRRSARGRACCRTWRRALCSPCSRRRRSPRTCTSPPIWQLLARQPGRLSGQARRYHYRRRRRQGGEEAGQLWDRRRGEPLQPLRRNGLSSYRPIASS